MYDSVNYLAVTGFMLSGSKEKRPFYLFCSFWFVVLDVNEKEDLSPVVQN